MIPHSSQVSVRAHDVGDFLNPLVVFVNSIMYAELTKKWEIRQRQKRDVSTHQRLFIDMSMKGLVAELHLVMRDYSSKLPVVVAELRLSVRYWENAPHIEGYNGTQDHIFDEIIQALMLDKVSKEMPAKPTSRRKNPGDEISLEL